MDIELHNLADEDKFMGQAYYPAFNSASSQPTQPFNRPKPVALDLNNPPRLAGQDQHPPPFNSSDSASTNSSDAKDEKKNSSSSSKKNKKQQQKSNNDEAVAPPAKTLRPSLALLFSVLPKSRALPLLIPGIILSIILSAIPPYMSILTGKSFSSFTDYAATVAVPGITSAEFDHAKRTLYNKSLLYLIQFIGLGTGNFVLTSISFTCWIAHGERVVNELRLLVYRGVGRHELEWFDLGMGAGDAGEVGEGKSNGLESEGAAGLMGRFSKETEEVRVATSSYLGRCFQAFVTFLTLIGVALYYNWKMTLVIISTLPFVVVAVGVTERFAQGCGLVDKALSAKAGSRIDRTLSALPTVKAFNAQDEEVAGLVDILVKARRVYNTQHLYWGTRGGITTFIALATFVQGFWFGSWLIDRRSSTVANVTTCFWCTLLATSNLQTIVPFLMFIEKGKVSMAHLLDLISTPPSRSPPTPIDLKKSPSTPKSKKAKHRHSVSAALSTTSPRFSFRRSEARARQRLSSDDSMAGIAYRDGDAQVVTIPTLLQTLPTPSSPSQTPFSPINFLPLSPRAVDLAKIRPNRFTGELGLKNVTFHYPTRPSPAPPALDNVSLYFAAKETTFVVGGSGSGKSTVASLLLGLYKPDMGIVEVDEQGLDWIDEQWLRGHVACVSQGSGVIVEGTVHENVAVGVVGQLRSDGSKRSAKDVRRDEVVMACTGACIHDFVKDLPQGYDTWLSGEKGASLSGGQRQRLALARAWLRDPTVLILDEATSALDVTSRSKVADAIKKWRKNKTTIIITHDLNPIASNDFVYVMADGRVVEQGYRSGLEKNLGGPFHAMAMAHTHGDVDEDDLNDLEEQIQSPNRFSVMANTQNQHSNFLLATPPSRPTSLVGSPHSRPTSTLGTPRARPKSFVFEGSPVGLTPPRRESRASYYLETSATVDAPTPFGFWAPPANTIQAGRELQAARRASAAFTPGRRISTASFTPDRRPSAVSLDPAAAGRRISMVSTGGLLFPNDDYANRRVSGNSFAAVDSAGHQATIRRPLGGATRIKHATLIEGGAVHSEWTGQGGGDDAVSITIVEESKAPRQMGVAEIFRKYYPTIPNKGLFWFGMFQSVIDGAITPVFSSLLAKLITQLGQPNSSGIVRQTSLLILLVAAIAGLNSFLKLYVLERCGMEWICELRLRCFRQITYQPKSWHDAPENSSSILSNMLVRDAEDARTLFATFAAVFIVFVTMLTMGLVWAFVVGWELSLVGLGLLPVFAILTSSLSSLQNKLEGHNKKHRETISIKFHQSISNIKAIRSMALEKVFADRFEESAETTYKGGLKAAPASACAMAIPALTLGLAQGVIYFMAAVLIVKGRSTFGRVVETYSLILFCLTAASGVLGFLPGLAKTNRACIDLYRLVFELPTDTKETEGRMTFPISGKISFDKVEFSYPSRPDVKVLTGLSFDVRPGEFVGVVGASGSGKSTVAALLQRLYEPDAGTILLDGRPLSRMDVRYLRDHTAVVSQNPVLFDMSIHDNIAYGANNVTRDDVIRAAQAAHVHEFISGLPEGYDTMLGDNASLISGGQAQRMSIARALVRPRELLILDECTSALDPLNQELVMETILSVKKNKTTLIITHKLDVMKECDRLLVLGEGGVVVETGTFEQLRSKPGGVFAALASQGEWEHQ
ncbi:P-loop containing nucleoside triphosphate hydrolase protein [Meredithblackwellia eburnea MCA 4105]